MKLTKRLKFTITLLLALVTIIGCSLVVERNINLSTITSSAQTSTVTSTNTSTNLNVVNPKKVIAIELTTLPKKLTYTANESVSIAGGELRVVYDDYSVKYVPTNENMLDLDRLNISSLGAKNIFIRYQEKDQVLFTSFRVEVVPYVVQIENVSVDIIKSDIIQGQQVSLKYQVFPLNAPYQNVKWISSNKLLARVDDNGLVTTINPGLVFIDVLINDIFTARSELNIIPLEVEATEIAAPSFSNIETIAISVSNFGVISGDTPTAVSGTTLKYSISSTNKTSNLSALTTTSTESDVNAFLTNPLGAKPTIVGTDNQKYLIVVELDSNSNVVAAGQYLIGIQDITRYTFDLTPLGVIQDDTTEYGGTNWYAIANSTLQTPISTWNKLTTKTEVEAAITAAGVTLALTTSKPTLNSSHIGKYLLIVELTNGDTRVGKADDRLIASIDIATLAINVNATNGSISGNTAVSAGNLNYALSLTNITSTVDTWHTATTLASLSSLNFNSSPMTLTHHDYKKYLIVVEEKDGKLVSAGITEILISPNSQLLLHLGSSVTGTTWNDLSSPAYNATLTNSPTVSTNWIEFNGNNQSAWISHNSALQPTFGLTMEQWIFANDWNYNNTFYLASLSYTQGGGYAMSLASRKFGVEIRANGVYQQPEISTENLVGWQHIVATFDGRYTRMYLNGSLVVTSDAGAGGPYPIQYSTTNGNIIENALFIGAEADSTNDSTPDTHYWNGKIGMTKIYGVALHPSLILESYNNTKATYSNVVSANLVRHFDAGNVASYPGTGTTWTDLVSNTPYTISGASSFNSANGGSIEFNGTNTFVAIGTPLSTVASFTKEAWVYADVVTSSRNILSSNQNVFWNNESTFGGGVSRSYSTVTSANFPAGVWKHVALTFNNSTKSIKLYIDGVQVDSDTATGLQYIGEVESIGSHPQNNTATTNASYWDGKIAQVRVYNGELSAQDILNNYNQTKNPFQ